MTKAGQVRQVLWWVLVGQVVVLAVTGLWLSRYYRPTAAQAWEDIYGLQSSVEWALRVRTVHRWTAVVAVFPTATALAALTVADRFEGAPRSARKAAGIAAWIAVPILLAATAYLGTLLGWDQVALRSVTVGTDVSGYGPIFRDQVRFVLIGGSEVSTATARAVFVLHVAGLPALAGASMLAARRWAGRLRAAAVPSNGVGVPD